MWMILAVPIFSLAAFGMAVFIACMLHQKFEGRWSERKIEFVSIIIFLASLGTPGYTAFGFAAISFQTVLLVQAGVGSLYLLVTRTKVMNYVEGAVVSMTLSVLISFGLCILYG